MHNCSYHPRQHDSQHDASSFAYTHLQAHIHPSVAPQEAAFSPLLGLFPVHILRLLVDPLLFVVPCAGDQLDPGVGGRQLSRGSWAGVQTGRLREL